MDDGKTFHDTYVVSDIPGIDSFKTLNQNERELEKGLTDMDNGHANDAGNYSREDAFKNNRARIYFDSDPNNKIFPGDSLQNSFPAFCACHLSHDTISIYTGLYATMAFRAQVLKHKFTSDFVFGTSGVYVYKSNPRDSSFKSEVDVKNKYQYLVFEQAPTFEPGQQLTGYLIITSNRFYELKSNDHLDSTYVIAKIFFTCKTFGKE